MTDLISRQAAIEAVEDVIRPYIPTLRRYEEKIPLNLAWAIMRLPSAQTEIVRCKDCKYHDDEEPGAVYCPDWVGGWVSEDFFCAGGERRGDDD